MNKLTSKVIAKTSAVAGAVGSLLVARSAWAQVGVPRIPQLRNDTIFDTIIAVVTWGLGIAGAVAVLYLIVGGFLYITAGGDEGRIEKAKNTIKNAIIGIVVILLALVIVLTLNEVLAP
ncbi:MAG: pilin [Candidatus Andersenbacteria bacterium]